MGRELFIIIEDGNITLRFTGEYRSGSKDYYDYDHGNYLPGDPPEVENFKVYVVDENELNDIEVTRNLKKKALDYYKSLFIEYYEENIDG